MQRTRLDAFVAVAVGVLGCAYRFLAHTSFSNDQFVHLARAQAWLAGDWPIRDYTEPGAVLTVGVSAAAQALFGQSLLPELLLSIAALGVGAAITCWVVIRLTSNRALGILAAVLQIVIVPRLYSYPKILLYPVGILLLLRYGERPTLGRLTAAAMWVAIAFLIRHDHGIFAAAATVVMLAAVHWREGATHAARHIGTFIALLVLCLMPFLIYVQAHLGLWTYLRLGLATYEGEGSRTVGTLPTFRIDSGPLFARLPADADTLRRIHIRWAASVGEASRMAHERAVPLLHAEHLDERTWRYRVERDRTDALRQLLVSQDVEDVNGVDRRTLEFDTRHTIWQAVLERLPWRGVRVGPPITSLGDNAGPFLFYSAWLLPIAAFFLWRGQPSQNRAPIILTLCALALVCVVGFQRDEPTIRTPDVFGTFPILFAWTLATLSTALPGQRTTARALTVTLLVIVCTSVAWLGRAGQMMSRLPLGEGPSRVGERVASIARSAREWPWSGQWPGDEEWKVARYAHDCTRPGDRLLVTWFAPEYYVFSRRPFAGREAVLMPLYRDPATYEARVLEAWKRQPVPIVLSEETAYPSFAAAYPELAKYIADHYRHIGAMPSRAGVIAVYADRERRSTRRDAELGWECFADG
jgi:hypothetical protein